MSENDTYLHTFAGDLIEAGACTPNCLLALGDEVNKCSCRCGGDFHGALIGASVPSRDSAANWWEDIDLQYALSLKPDVSEIGSDFSDFNEIWRQNKNNYSGITRHSASRTFSVLIDVYGIRTPRSDNGEWIQFKKFLRELILRRRASLVTPPIPDDRGYEFRACGIKSFNESLVIWAAAVNMMHRTYSEGDYERYVEALTRIAELEER